MKIASCLNLNMTLGGNRVVAGLSRGFFMLKTMEIHLNSTSTFRVRTGRESNFIDVHGCDWEGAIAFDFYPFFQYIEIRKKNGLVRVFAFESRRHKKDMDLGWWSDANVIFSINEKNKS